MIDYEFSGPSRALVLRPDLPRGWRFHRKVWGFCHDAIIDAPDARTVRVQLQILQNSSGISNEDGPVLLDAHGPTDPTWFVRTPDGMRQLRSPVRWTVKHGLLTVTVDLFRDGELFNPDLHWRLKRNGSLDAHFQDDGLVDARDVAPFSL